MWCFRIASCPLVLLAATCTFLAAVLGGDIPGDVDSFPGWLGASYSTEKRQEEKRKPLVDLTKVMQLSAWKPRAYLYQRFLTEEECDHIIAKANPKLQRSSVANSHSGQSETSEIRTSSGMFIMKGEDAVIQGIEERISEWTFLPVANQEAMQVLRYGPGQKYEPHVDYFSDPVNKQRGGHRYATVLMYLNNVTMGGETVFPSARDPTPKDDSWSDCAKGFLSVKPSKGDALLFFSMHPDGSPDATSLHYACPVVEGVKWSAPVWIHVQDFNTIYKFEAEQTQGGSCSDMNALCGTWAKLGECKNNPVYMTKGCRRACMLC